MNAPELTAVERLALSRERLRLAMTQATGRADHGPGANTHVAGLLGLIKTALPNASLLIDALSQWWTHYAAQGPGQTVAGVADNILKPLAKRYPLLVVAGAVAVGGLLAWSRPWRWVFKPPLLAVWGPALVSSALASGTLQEWILAAMAKNPVPPAPPVPESTPV